MVLFGAARYTVQSSVPSKCIELNTQLHLSFLTKGYNVFLLHMEAPKIPGLFKTRGYKRFNFPARYYDEQKERIAKRREEIKRELKADEKLSSEDKERFREMLRSKSRFGGYRKDVKKSNVRFAIILVFLVALAVWMWNKAESLI